MNDVLDNQKFDNVFKIFHVYLADLKTKNGPMCKFWKSYITMVNTLLDLIHASREGNVFLHLEAVESIIPWCFAYDRTNYSRYLPWYVHSMKDLQTSNPPV